MSDSPKRGGLIGFFTRNTVAANLLMVVMLIGGLMAARSINTQIFPTIDLRQIYVSVTYPGATPSEVEESITRRVEEAVLGVDGVERVLSTASENYGIVTIEMKDFVDGIQVRNDVQSAVDQLTDFPPENAEEPDIVLFNPVTDVITLVVTSDQGEKGLREAAEFLEQELLSLPKVYLVELQGVKDYEISIEVDEDTLRKYGLSMAEVAGIVEASSINLGAGSIRTESGDILIRTDLRAETGPAFENIVIRSNPDGTILRLSDIAVIRDAFEDEDLINTFDGVPGIYVKVSKSESEDTIEVITQIRDMLETVELPAGVSVQIWDDQVRILEERINLLVRNAILGFALVFLFLCLMLDLRLAFWVAMGVPISFLGAFLFFDAAGVTINMISLFALIIVLGIVVDDAIVVGENIFTEQRRGNTGINGAIDGTLGVVAPVTVGVLTTMLAFAPLIFAMGIFGQILNQVPVVVILVLLMSLIEVYFILPAHLSHDGTWSKGPLLRLQNAIADGLASFRDKRLIPAVEFTTRWRYATLAAGFAIVMICFSFVTNGHMKYVGFPSLEPEQITAEIEFPEGTPFEITNAAANRVISAAETVKNESGEPIIETIGATIGGKVATPGGPPGLQSSTTVSSNIALIQLQLTPAAGRSTSAEDIVNNWRREVGVIPGVKSLTYVADVIGAGAEVDFQVSHRDEEILNAAVAELKAKLDTVPGTVDIRDTIRLGKRQFDITLTPTGEATGLKPRDVALQVRQNFFGVEVDRIQRGREEVRVFVRYPREDRRSLSDFYNTRIRLPDGTELPLLTVAELSESRALASIDRINGRRGINVRADVDEAENTATSVNNRILNEFGPELMEKYPGLKISQEGVGREQQEDFAAIGQMMLVGLLCIFALLASQLRSYTQPLIIMLAIPFGISGAFLGHMLLGFDLSFISMFGIVALSGIVINDSVVLVDRYNVVKKRDQLGAFDAAISATRRRFRPIFLTTLTTALGLFPMLMETSIQAQFLIPMAVAIAFGILFASVMILFMVPAMIVAFEEVGMFRWYEKLFLFLGLVASLALALTSHLFLGFLLFIGVISVLKYFRVHILGLEGGPLRQEVENTKS